MKNERLHYWDNLKALLIICVVVGHVVSNYINKCDLGRYVGVFIYSFHMPLFAYVSGIFAAKSKRDSTDKIPKLFTYYLVMETVYAFVKYFIMHDRAFNYSYTYPYYTYWWILFLIQVYFIIPFIKKYNPYIWIFVTVLISLYIGTDKNVSYQFNASRFFYFLPFFLLGFYFDESKVVEKVKKNRIILIIINVAIMYVLLFKTSVNTVNFIGALPYSKLSQITTEGIAYRCIAYITAITMSMLVMSLVPKTSNKLISYVGRNTLTIYLTHGIVFEYLNFIWKDTKWSNNEYRQIIIDGSIKLLIIILACIITLIIKEAINKGKTKQKNNKIHQT